MPISGIFKIKVKPKFSILALFSLLIIYASAQSYMGKEYKQDLIALNDFAAMPTDTVPAKKKATNKGEPKLIKLVHAGVVFKQKDKDYSVLKDSVIFLHEGAYLYCDSAYRNEFNNTFEAFSNVRMEQGDTLFLYGDRMIYNGNTQLVAVRENVKMDHRSGTLFTDSLNYDRLKNVGYYFDGGLLVDSINELTSFAGQYEPGKSLATFSDEVVLVNPNYKLFSDTLLYSADTRIAKIVSPTTIESDSGYIYSNRGWYNTITEHSVLLDQSTVINKEGNQLLRGDSILYYRYDNSGEVFGHMFLQDTVKKIILKGNYGFYNGKTEYGYAVDSASMIEYSQKDSLYLHADTLEMLKLPPAEFLSVRTRRDTLQLFDSEQNPIDSVVLHTDSVREMKAIHQIKAYYGVRFYRSDLQGLCDSLQFSSLDSILYMYKDPVLWNLDRQLTGDTIDIVMNDSTIDHVYVKGRAFAIEQKDSIHFNQLKSRVLQFFFEDGKIKRVFANGNVETIVYPEEKDGTLNQVLNWLTSSYLEIHMLDGQFDRLKAWPAPVGKTTPFHLITSDQLRLTEFYWYDYMRPLDKDDIFRKVKRRAGDQRKERPAVFEREE